jgi:hypothetical protein
MVSVNAWVVHVDIGALKTLLKTSLWTSIADVILNEMTCRFTDALTSFRHVAEALDFGSLSPLPIDSKTTREIIKPSKLIRVEDLSIRISSNQVAPFDSLIQLERLDFAYDFDDDLAEVAEENGEPTKRDLKTDFFGCFERIRNIRGVPVGQILGKCLRISSPVSLPAAAICLPLVHPNVTRSGIFSNFFFAQWTTTLQGEDVFNPVKDVAPSMNENGLCAVINIPAGSNTVYCPANGIPGYRNIGERKGSPCAIPSSWLNDVSAELNKISSTKNQIIFRNTPQINVIAGKNFKIVVEVMNDKNELMNGVGIMHVRLEGDTSSQWTGRVVGGRMELSISIEKVGRHRLVAHMNGLLSSTTDWITVQPGLATAMKILRQPAGAVLLVGFLQMPLIAVVDAYGNIVTDYVGSIAIRAETNALTQEADTAIEISKPGLFSIQVKWSRITESAIIEVQGPGLQVLRLGPLSVNPPSKEAVQLYSRNPSTVSIDEPIEMNIDVLDFQRLAARSLPNVFATVELWQNDVLVKHLFQTHLLSVAERVFSIRFPSVGSNYTLAISAPGLASFKSENIAVNGPHRISLIQQPPELVYVGETFSISFIILDIFGQTYPKRPSEVMSNLSPAKNKFFQENEISLNGTTILTYRAQDKVESVSLEIWTYVSGVRLSISSAPFTIASSHGQEEDTSTPTTEPKSIYRPNTTVIGTSIILVLIFSTIFLLVGSRLRQSYLTKRRDCQTSNNI